MSLPNPAEMSKLRPINRKAWLLVIVNTLLLSSGLVLAQNHMHLVFYLVGQVLLALGFSQAFIVMHEAGHHTLFKQRILNDTIGIITGFFALIPYATWRPIHAGHHRYTGWQDLDSTTASLLPRSLSRTEQFIINFAWRFWLPLFSVLYRIQNYWRISRIAPFLKKNISLTKLYLSVLLQFLAYIGLIAWIGPSELALLIGPGLLLALMLQDLILLGQHTHMPTHISGGKAIRRFRPIEQSPFTRSVRLPNWLSWLLLHFDAHELHHMYPAVPGYLLLHIPYTPPNEILWSSWLKEAKAMSGTNFLFGGPHLTMEKQ